MSFKVLLSFVAHRARCANCAAHRSFVSLAFWMRQMRVRFASGHAQQAEGDASSAVLHGREIR